MSLVKNIGTAISEPLGTRVWDIKGKRMMTTGFVLTAEGAFAFGFFNMLSDIGEYKIQRDHSNFIIMWSTGTPDKENRMIFGGDVLLGSWHANNGRKAKHEDLFEVYWSATLCGNWSLTSQSSAPVTMLYYPSLTTCKIVGNVWEDPKLRQRPERCYRVSYKQKTVEKQRARGKLLEIIKL